MKAIIKGRWFILVGWITFVTILMLLAPNMADLVREKGDLVVPKGYSSSLANEIINEIKEGNQSQVALVFHSDEKLTKKEITQAKEAIQSLKKNQSELGITEITSHFYDKELE